MTVLEIVLFVSLLFTLYILVRFTFKLRKKYTFLENEQSKTTKLYVTDQLSMTIVCNSDFLILDVINPKETILLKIPVIELKGFNARKLEQVVWKKYKEQARILIKSLQKSLDTKQNYYTEYVLELDNGKRFYVFFLFEYVSEERVCCHITTLDAFSLYRERELLKETNLNLKLALDTSQASVWQYDVAKDRFDTLVGEMLAQTGASFDDCYQILHPDSRESYVRIFDNLINGRSERETYTFHFHDPQSGESNYFLSQMAADRNAQGKTVRIIGTQKDVSVELNTRKELELKYNLLDAIHENMPIGMALFDKHGVCSTVNKFGLSMYGTDDQTPFVGKYSILKDPNAQKEIKNAILECKSLSMLCTYNMEAIDNFIPNAQEYGVRHFDCKVLPIGVVGNEAECFLVLFSDVTDFMRNAQKTEELALKYEAIFNSMSSSIEIINNIGQTLDLNESAFDLFGVVDRTDYLSARRSVLSNPILSDQEKQKLKNNIEFVSYIDYDFDKVNETGYYRSSRTGKAIIELKYTPMRNKEGEVVGGVLLSSDVTENILLNKKYEDLYRQQEAILSLLPVGVEVYDKEGTLIYHNLVGQRLVGSGNLKRKINLFDNPNLTPILAEEIKQGKDINVQMEYDFDKIIKANYHDTEKRGITYIDMKTSAVKDDHGSILFYPVVFQDISEEILNKQKIEEINMKLRMVVHASAITPWDYDRSSEQFYFYIDGESAYLHQSMSLNEFIEFIHPDDQKKARQAFEMMSEGKNESFHFEIKYRSSLSSDSEWRYGAISGHPYLFDKNENVSKYTGWRKDTSEWKHLTNQLVQMNRQNKLILDNTHSGFIYFSLDYKIQWENISTVFKGYSIANKYQIGLVCYKEVKGLDAPCPGCVLIDAISKKKIARREVCLENNIFVEMIATPVFNEDGDSLEGVVMRVDDITKRKLTNLELKEAKEKAEQSNQLKSAFLANMSHEIRTPLNAIVGFSDIALNAESEDEKEEYRKIISTNSELLINLINDILDLSKIESGYLEMNLDTVDFSILFNEVNTSFSLRMNPEVTLICQNPYKSCVIHNIDKQRVLQVITNFISNAIKFTPQGSITIGYISQNNGLKIYVQDTGIGISEENKKKVFHRFQKFDTFAQGTGLGLSICRAIIDAMKGEIGFDSTEGQGSTFWAWFPCEVGIIEQITESVSNNKQCKYPIKGKTMEQVKILVAEDNNSNFLLLRAILKEYTLTRAVNGLEAVALAKNAEFDLILMDIKMPEMNGLEATAEIRKFNTDIPIIALTANAFDSDKEEAFKAGCNDFLTKPLNKEALFRVISEL